MSFECLDCKAIDGGYCKACATPNDDLVELAREWREDAEERLHLGEAEMLAEVADELESVVYDE